MKRAYWPIVRDAFLLMPRLLGVSLAIFASQVMNLPARRLRRLTSVAWLARRLEIEPDQIKSARIEEVHSGTASRSRLHIDYAVSEGPRPGPPSLFIKSTPPDFAGRLFGALFDLGGKEVAFYGRVRSEIPVESPRVFHCEGDSRDYIMLLEDLTDKNCRFRTLAEKCSREDALSIFTTLGRLHAHLWQSERFDADLAWVRRFETDRDFRLLNLVRHLSVPIACERFSQALPEPVREIIPCLMDQYLRLEEAWAEEPRTLIHGDAHLGNMYFREGQAGLLDWQVNQYGQGMRDISYFLINSMSEELRLAHQEELIRHYLATLSEHGVTLDFDTAWRQHRLQSVYAWIAGIVTAPSNFQGEEVVTAGLTRSSRALLDLDAISLIRAL